MFSNGSSEAKTLTGAEHLIDLVGQPRLANSWWPGAVISEELATAAALRQQQALLTRLAELAADSSADDAAAINALRQQIQALKVTGRQKSILILISSALPNAVTRRCRATTRCGSERRRPRSRCSGLSVVLASSHSLQVATWRAISLTRACSAVRIAATRGWFTGRTRKAPVAYWNKRHVEPMPGSIIYVGLADSVWSETPDALNADILQTLTQRIPQ